MILLDDRGLSPFSFENKKKKHLVSCIGWLMFDVNFRSITAILWHEQILKINFHNYKTLRNKTYLCIKQLSYK